MFQTRTATFTVVMTNLETIHIFPQAWLDDDGTNGTTKGDQVWLGGGYIHNIDVRTTTALGASDTLEVWDYRTADGKPLVDGATKTNKRYKFDASAFTSVTQVGDGVLATKDDGEAAFSAGTKLAEFGLAAATLTEPIVAQVDCPAGMLLQITTGTSTTGTLVITVTYSPRGYGTGFSRYRDSIQAGISYADFGGDYEALVATAPDTITNGAAPVLTFNAGHGLSIGRTHYQTTTSGITDIPDDTYATTVLNETQIQLTDATSAGTTIGGGTAQVVFPRNRIGAASNPAFHA